MRGRTTSRVAAVALRVVLALAATGIGRSGRGQTHDEAPFAEVVLLDARGRAVALDPVLAGHRFTTIVFYSATCPCFAAHIARLRELVREFSAVGVAVIVVDSERRAAGPGGMADAVTGGLAVLRDVGGQLARRLGARFATESFVFDSKRQLRYRGGIDGDRAYLRPTTEAHLRNAVRSLITGSAPTLVTAKALGCALRLL